MAIEIDEKIMSDTVILHGRVWDYASLADRIEDWKARPWKEDQWSQTLLLRENDRETRYVGQNFDAKNAWLSLGSDTSAHCLLCGWIFGLSADPGCNTGYKDDNGKWLCSECYTKVIAPLLKKKRSFKMSKEEQAKVFHDFLADEGFRPELTEHFDVMFKFEGGTYFIVPDADDRQYFQLSYMYFWEIENEQELENAYFACNEANRMTKTVKLSVTESKEDTCAYIELFVDDPKHLQPVFNRCMSALKAGVNRFRSQMQELNKPDEE